MMNQVAKLGEKVAITGGEGGFSVTPQTLNDVVEFAKFMCQSNAGIPAYLRNNGPDCAAIIMQALKWGFDPFSVAQKSYKVKDILAYEAQLIAAVINARSGIKGRLKYHFEGSGDDLTCTVTGMLDGEDCVYTSPRVGNITTKNSPLWKTDPQQQLGYFSARSWARRHCPEVILGVYDRDEAEQFQGPDSARDITPSRPSLSDRLQQASSTTQTSQDAREGFSATFDRAEPDFASVAQDGDYSNSDCPPQSETEAGDTVSLTASPASPDPVDEDAMSDEDNAQLVECAVKLFAITQDESLMPLKRREALAMAKETWKAALDERLHEKLKSIFVSADAVIRGNADYEAATDVFADVLGCDVAVIRGQA